MKFSKILQTFVRIMLGDFVIRIKGGKKNFSQESVSFKIVMYLSRKYINVVLPT